MKQKLSMMVIIALMFFFSGFGFLYAKQKIDLAFLMDGSSSIASTDFATEKEGIAKAIEDPTIIPRDGNVTITVIQFSGESQVRCELEPTAVTENNITTIASTIRNITQYRDGTYFAPPIDLAVAKLMALEDAGTRRQAINLITDGNNTDGETALVSVNTAISSGIDIINAIGIGSNIDEDYLWQLVRPQYQGYPARPTEPSKDYGFVWTANRWEDFGDIIKIKILTEVFVQVPETTDGLLVYVKNVERNSDGIITKTGNIFIKDTSTKNEKQITNYTGNFIITNPAFSSNAAEIIYTSNISGKWQIHLIESNRYIGNPIYGIICNNGKDHPYAALSPDDRYIVYVEQDGTGTTQLRYYDRNTDKNYLIYNNPNLKIGDVAFFKTRIIVFKGTQNNGIQDIYRINMDGSNLTKLTNNSSITPCYEGLKSSFCHSDQYQEYIVYSKRVWQGFGYGKWDVFRFDVQTSEEINLTNSPDKDEYDPVFRSIFDEKEGFIFYSANVFSENAADVWSAYYNTEDIENTNLSLVFWTGNFNTTEKAGEIDFISKDKLAAQTTGEIISIKDTRIVYTNGDISGTYIYRSDNDGTTWETEVISPFETRYKTVFAIDPTGGKIIYGVNTLPSQLVRINHDGTAKTAFAQSTSYNEIKDACWSPDGRWVVFVKQEGIGKYGIYAKMATQDISQSDTGLLTDVSAYDIEHPCFSPSGTELVFSQKTINNPSYDIYMLSIRINDTTSINTGILTQLTYTSTIDERHPSYSPDGKKIMFLSNNPLGNINQIYTMDTNGSGLELVVAGTNDEGQDINLRKPVFGIANDNPDSYYIAYISDNADSSTTIKIATLPKIDSTPGDGKNLATLYQDTGLKPSNISENFAWGRKRNKGTIVAQRIISEKTAKNQTFQYKIAIDVDEAAPPNAYTLEEIVSENFSNIQVSIDGSALFNPDITTNPGYKTIKILFGVGLNGGVKDHVVIFQMDAPNEIGNAFIEGKIRYNLEGPSPMGTATISVISGNSSISISNPFIPVDIYTNENAKSSDGIIGDWDILYAIDAWANNNQLSGFGIRWPMDINNWDMIMLAIIDIWTSPAGTQGTHTGGLASDPSIEAGEYQYIGPYLYTTGGGSGINEMYWTQGKWVD